MKKKTAKAKPKAKVESPSTVEGSEAKAPTPMWQQDLATARLHMAALDDTPAALWKSIFESEEGYLAPLQQPRLLPGVVPW